MIIVHNFLLLKQLYIIIIFFFISIGDEKILDPRAGRVNVDMPEIFFDALEIANVFESMKYKKKTRSKNRKSIDYVVNT